MKKINYILILLISINSLAQSNENIKLLNSNKLISGPKNSNYWVCIGNVIFEHNETLIYCDSSHHFMKMNKMLAFGNVKIKKGDSLHANGKKLIYNGNQNTAHLTGGIILKDKYTQLTTNEIIFNLEDNIAYYPKEGTIIDDNITLTSDQGKYNTKSHLFFFKKNVRVKSTNYTVETDTLHYNSKSKIAFFLGPSYIFSDNNTIYCENGWYNTKTNLSQFNENAYISNKEHLIKGDSLFYNRNKGYGKAMNNISMIDTVNNIIINGDLSEYFEKEDKIEVTKKALLNILFEKDTLFMSAKKFISYNNDNKYILAYNDVKIFKEDFQGKCDSLYYNINDSMSYLYESPILWVDGMQITADTINIHIANKKIDKMNLFPNPMVIAKADSLYFNQIKGKYMTGVFKKNKLRKLNVFGNGQSLFLIEEDNKNDVGINKVICTDISINMQEGKLKSIIHKVSPNSTTIPIQDVSESNKYLEGFIWKIEEKPNDKKDIME